MLHFANDGQAHFVENDPWVVNQVLLPNLALTNFEEDAVVHTTRVETYLQQARDRGGGYSCVVRQLSVADLGGQ